MCNSLIEANLESATLSTDNETFKRSHPRGNAGSVREREMSKDSSQDGGGS